MSHRFAGALSLALALVWLGACGSSEPMAVEREAVEPTAPPATAAETPPATPAPILLMPPDLDRVASAFVRFATGRNAYPPADTPITLYLGGRPVTTLAGRDVGDRTAWRICPEGGSYAGALCPFSALDLLVEHEGELAVTTERLEHPCAHPTRPRVVGHSVTLTPREPQTCVSYFAVELHVNDVGQVTDVDLVMAEP